MELDRRGTRNGKKGPERCLDIWTVGYEGLYNKLDQITGGGWCRRRDAGVSTEIAMAESAGVIAQSLRCEIFKGGGG